MFTASTEIVYVPAFSNNALSKLYSGAIVDSTNVSFKYTLYDSAPFDASHENLNDASSVPVYANPVTATGTFTSSSVDDDEFDSSFFVESVSSFFVESVSSFFVESVSSFFVESVSSFFVESVSSFFVESGSLDSTVYLYSVLVPSPASFTAATAIIYSRASANKSLLNSYVTPSTLVISSPSKYTL